jgi:hypothetical protein
MPSLLVCHVNERQDWINLLKLLLDCTTFTAVRLWLQLYKNAIKSLRHYVITLFCHICYQHDTGFYSIWETASKACQHQCQSIVTICSLFIYRVLGARATRRLFQAGRVLSRFRS